MNQRTLNILVVVVSCVIVGVFAFGELNWSDDWWVLAAWFLPLLGGWPMIAKYAQSNERAESE